MKYVKLVARPNTWFKEGTEVYEYDSDYSKKKRLTLEEYQRDWEPYGIICVRGIRVGVLNYEVVGEEREDGESCGIDEFDVEIIEE